MTRKGLQAAIRRERGNHKRTAARYPEELRKAVAEFVLAERSRGVSLGALVNSLDLPINTLRRWCERHGGTPRMSPVEVVDGGFDRPVLVTPSGHRVEGLSPSSLLALLEQLG